MQLATPNSMNISKELVENMKEGGGGIWQVISDEREELNK
jgi:hypothetical protein